MTKRPKANRRQQDILDAIRTYTEAHGWPPSRRDIAEMIGVRSSSGVHEHLKRMERDGLVALAPHQQRGIRILGDSEPVDE